MPSFGSVSPYRVYRCKFDASDPACSFIVDFSPLDKPERNRLFDKARINGQVSAEKLAELVAGRVKGWRGFTPREAERLGLFERATADSIAATFTGGDVDKEIAFAPGVARDFAAHSDKASERFGELLDLDKCIEAEEALAKNA